MTREAISPAKSLDRAVYQVESRSGFPPADDPLLSEWRDLCLEGPCNEPFYLPEWIKAHIHAFAEPSQIRLLTVRCEGRLRAILPLLADPIRLMGVTVRRWRSAANYHSGRFDLIHGADDKELAALAVWEYLRRQKDWDLIQLQEVPRGGAAEQLLVAALIDQFPVQKVETTFSPFIPLPGPAGSLDSVLARTRSKFQANLRRRRRNLSAKGSLELTRLDQADPQWLDQFYELERAGWKGQEGTAIACDRRTRQFYDLAAQSAALGGYLSLFGLELDGKPIAMHFGLTYNGRYYLPKLAYDEDLKEFSPGQLIVADILADCVDRGLVEFDFLGPMMDWKGEWTGEVRPHSWLYIFNRSLLGRSLFHLRFSLAPQLKRVAAKVKRAVRQT